MSSSSPVRRALLSVYRKDGLVPFASALSARGVELFSTGGTRRALLEAGIPVGSVSDLTGHPEILDGRVKSLHPRIHGGLLARRDDPGHLAELEELGLPPMDMVVCNLYPFEAATSDPGCDMATALENIDIGGPTMIRAAAKAHPWVTVVVDPGDYDAVLEALESGDGETTPGLRFGLARKAFAHTARYDAAISAWLSQEAGEAFPASLSLPMERGEVLRYGENPHQRAALYVEPTWSGPTLARATQLQGKPLSYNNLYDADAALALVLELPGAAAAVIKHANPCGAGTHPTDIVAAFERALETDPLSAFGGIIALNRPVDADLVRALGKRFFEVLVAPSVTEEARELLAKRKRMRVLTVDQSPGAGGGYDMKRIRGGWLLSDWDVAADEQWTVATERQPTPEEWDALRFAWSVVPHVKSNAIVLTNAFQTVGIGAGQMSRVDAVELSVRKARLPLQGAALASDAFFPFRDGVDAAAEAGIRAVIQPGGSIRDDEVVAACNERGLTMVLTGARHFRH